MRRLWPSFRPRMLVAIDEEGGRGTGKYLAGVSLRRPVGVRRHADQLPSGLNPRREGRGILAGP
jgi:hypothetical protein